MVTRDKVGPIWDNHYPRWLNTFSRKVVSKTFSKNYYAIRRFTKR